MAFMSSFAVGSREIGETVESRPLVATINAREAFLTVARGIGDGPQSGRRSTTSSGAVVESDVVAIGVGEGEGATERAVDRPRDDRVAVGCESVVDLLDVCGVQPD